MQITSIGTPKSWNLVMFGDSHEGNTLQYRKGYLETLNYILKTPRTGCIHMGDAVESIYIADKRYDKDTISISPLEAKRNVIEQLRPLVEAKKLFAILDGNHERALRHAAGDINLDICQALGIKHQGWSACLSFAGPDGKTQFKGFFTHGHKLIRTNADDPIRRASNEKLQLKQHLKNKMGDCLLMVKGHTHKLIVAEPQETVFLGTEGREIKEHYTRSAYKEHTYIHPDHRWYVSSGSYLKTFGIGVSSYSEVAEYDPIEIGYAVATIEDGQLVGVRRVVL